MSWFGRKKSPCKLEPDSIWLSREAKTAGVSRRAGELVESGQVVVLAHFPATLEAVAGSLSAALGARRVHSTAELTSRLESPRAGVVLLALVADLPGEIAQSFADQFPPVAFLVAERHPHRTQDDLVERLAATLPYASSLQFHLSVEGPLLDRFGGDGLNSLLTQLGVGADEALSHPMIDRAVRRAQEKLGAQQAPEIETSSSDDWFRAIEP